MTTVAIVPARKGSTRLPGKNRMKVGLLELWQRAAAVATLVPGVDEVIVSTDYEDIAPSMLNRFVVVRRPPELCTAEAKVEDAIIHALRPEHDLVVLLNPTNPFRRIATVAEAIRRAKEGGGSCICLAEQPAALYHWRVDPQRARAHFAPGSPLNDCTSGHPRSQDLQAPLCEHGAAFVVPAAHVREHRNLYCEPISYVLTEWCESVDIDTAEDYHRAVALAPLYLEEL